MLEIVEYERKLSDELSRAKQQAEEIIAQAKKKAKESLEEEKAKLSVLDKQYQEKLKKDVEQEKDKILQEKNKTFKKIENIELNKISQLIEFVVRKVTLL